VAGGLILAGAVLSQNPWRSVDGYAGHSAGVQLLALASVAMLAASNVSLYSKTRSDLRNELTFADEADYSVSSKLPRVSVKRRFSE
ncbi:MAG: arabinofuranan 3-O-arabinosyltransferase, partial [Mycobacterium sp.]|nr:arabinofuranan 3-O-arabinosyltransferase [Mycobacterium sp.]